MRWAIGDLQGCHRELLALLAKIEFSPSRDVIYLAGDLVNRGPASLQVLKTLVKLGASAQCVLGNHDLHLLAVVAGVRQRHRQDTLDEILNHKRRDYWLDWLRQQPLLRQIDDQTVMVHAGLVPQWSIARAACLADEVSRQLASPDWYTHLAHMYGNEPDAWDDQLPDEARLRVIVNALTRLRFCSEHGRMDFKAKGGIETAPPGLMPWFRCPQRASAEHTIVFGHWSTLGLCVETHLLGLDTGCVWGGALSAVNLDTREIVQVAAQA